MQCFDPDKFAVFAEPVMTVLEHPEYPLSGYGRVRDVQFVDDDLPVRCICFTTQDVGGALGVNPRMFHKYLNTWGWWTPKYKSANVRLRRTDPVLVYTYPEMQVIFGEYQRSRGFGKGDAGTRSNPALAARVNKALASIRHEIEEIYDDHKDTDPCTPRTYR